MGIYQHLVILMGTMLDPLQLWLFVECGKIW